MLKPFQYQNLDDGTHTFLCEEIGEFVNNAIMSDMDRDNEYLGRHLLPLLLNWPEEQYLELDELLITLFGWSRITILTKAGELLEDFEE